MGRNLWLVSGLTAGLALSGCKATPRPTPASAPPKPAASPASPGDTAFAEGEAFDGKRETDQAFQRFEAAAAAYAAEGRWDAHVRSQARAAAQRIRRGQLDEAEVTLARVYASGVVHLGKAHPALADVVTQQGSGELFRERYDQALAHFERALRMLAAAGEKPGLAVARLYNLMGEVHSQARPSPRSRRAAGKLRPAG